MELIKNIKKRDNLIMPFDKEKITSAMKVMESLRARYKSDRELATSYIVKMRDERVKKWKK